MFHKTGFVRIGNISISHGMMPNMNTRAIDTHCHPQMRQYDADREDVIRRALDAGVGMVCVGVDLPTSRQAVELAHRYEGLYASVGLHPNDNLDEEYEQTEYVTLAGDQKVVAIGEIGLDYYRTTEPEKKAFQKKRFEQQLELVRTTGKPVIIHCRDAHADMQNLLRTHDVRKGVIHSFTSTLADALLYIEQGFHVGFNGIITFARQYDEAVRGIPADRILLETDSPYLTPQPYRGRRNEPVYILETARAIAELRGISQEELLRQTTENTMALFKIE